MKEDILKAKKLYNSQLRMWQYISDGRVLITCKTERGLDSNWEKYKKIFD